MAPILVELAGAPGTRPALRADDEGIDEIAARSEIDVAEGEDRAGLDRDGDGDRAGAGDRLVGHADLGERAPVDLDRDDAAIERLAVELAD